MDTKPCKEATGATTYASADAHGCHSCDFRTTAGSAGTPKENSWSGPTSVALCGTAIFSGTRRTDGTHRCTHLRLILFLDCFALVFGTRTDPLFTSFTWPRTDNGSCYWQSTTGDGPAFGVLQTRLIQQGTYTTRQGQPCPSRKDERRYDLGGPENKATSK